MLKLRKILLCDSLYYISLILIIIYIIYSTKIVKYYSKYNINTTNFNLIIENYKIDGNKLSINLIGKENLVGRYYFKTEEEKNNFINEFNFGDKLKIQGTLEEPSNNTIPNLFNYKKYLYNKNIFYILNINDIKKIESSNNLIVKIKNYLYKQINKLDNKNYIYAFILGETYYIDNTVNDSYKANGISHLFALSGQNVEMVASLILFLLNKISKNEKFNYIIVFIFLIFMTYLTNYPGALLRATIFYFLLTINKIYYFYIKSENLLLLSFIILSIFNPFIIYDIGFEYSFIISFFLIRFSKYLNSKNAIKNLFLVGVVSFYASLPISLMNFYYLNIFSVINNLFFVPYVSYIVYPLVLITFFINKLSFILNIFIYIMEKISLLLSNIKMFTFSYPKVSIFFSICYYSLLLLFSIKKKKIYIFLIMLLLFIFYIKRYFDNNTYIYFTDVGQGDSSLIVDKNFENIILIDTGGKINYKTEEWKNINNKYSLSSDSLIPFYRSLGINKINYLIFTHGDADHMGEGINLVNNFKVENVIFNCGEFNDLENELINILKEKNIKYYSCINILDIDKYKLEFLNTNIYDDENTNSSVIYLNYNNYKFLFMGDASINREKDILEKYNLKDIDFLKVGHHGSNTSSSEEFINIINPKYSIISVGKNNKYGHPKKEVLNTLKNSKIYRTDLSGSIEVKINKNGYKINTYSP